MILPHDEYNQKLLSHVHPEGWINPIAEPMYNLVVIGAGTAGLIASNITAALGGKVALIERDLMGGDCLNVGCVPSKSLIRPARLAAEMRKATEFGLQNIEINADAFPKIMERLRRIRAEISVNDSVQRYSDLGVDVFLGQGVFLDANTIQVGEKRLRFRKAVIATGARAVKPPIEGLDDIDYLTNETIFNLTKLPKRLLVLGGGPIGCEMAQAFRRLGSEVTIVQNSRFLPNEDPDASALLANVFKKEGINVVLDAKVMRAFNTPEGLQALAVEHDGQEEILEADVVLVGVGRAPNVQDLGLEKVDVEFDKYKGIVVNDFLCTTNQNIYAAGDCCMAWKFTHAADAAAQIVVQNALFKGRKKLSDLVMPWCTYTDPEIAHVGMYEKEALARGLQVESFMFPMHENDRALADGESNGFVKIMVKKGNDKILGATIVSAHAGEMISEITTAIVGGVGLSTLSGVIHPYPTQADAIRRTAGLYRKSKLTPFVAKLLKWWLGRQI